MPKDERLAVGEQSPKISETIHRLLAESSEIHNNVTSIHYILYGSTKSDCSPITLDREFEETPSVMELLQGLEQYINATKAAVKSIYERL